MHSSVLDVCCTVLGLLTPVVILLFVFFYFISRMHCIIF
jgi:hypothetical protein